MKKKTLATGLSALVLAAGTAWACSCLPVTPEENYDQSVAVFSGTVLSVTLEVLPGGTFRKVTALVTGCWKGSPGGLATVWTYEDEDVCGIETFAVGEEWLFYASSSGLGGFFTTLCDRSQQFPILQEDADFLGPAGCPVSVDAVSWGQVKATYR
jgi:hypothetical protein